MREHGDHHTVHNLKLRLVGGCHLDEDVGSVHRDLGVVAVDDRRQRANGAVGVVDNRVDRGVTDDVQIFTQLLVLLLKSLVTVQFLDFWGVEIRGTYLVEGHQFFSIHLLGLVQGSEFNVLGREGLVGERTLDSVEVVSTNGNQSSLTGQVLVKFILEGNEGLITGLVELDSAQDSGRDVGSDFCGL